MLHIIGRNNSSNVQKVLWTCAEIGLDFERTDFGGPFGGNDDPEYRAKNPNGLIPTVEDGDLVLWESNSIVRYLAAKHGGGSRFYPADPGARALADRWMDWQLTVIWPALLPAFLNLIRTPEDKRDMDVVATAVAKANAAAKILDTHLTTNAYLGGADFTIGDIPVGVVTYRYMNLDIERPSLPNLEAYYARLCNRPGYQKYLMIGLS